MIECTDCCIPLKDNETLWDDEDPYCSDCWDARAEEAMFNDNPERYFGTDR